MLSHFHRIPESNGPTDRRTDGRTNKIAISLSRISVLTRDKKLSNVVIKMHRYIATNTCESNDNKTEVKYNK